MARGYPSKRNMGPETGLPSRKNIAPVVRSIMGWIWGSPSPPGGGQTENITFRYPSDVDGNDKEANWHHKELVVAFLGKARNAPGQKNS